MGGDKFDQAIINYIRRNFGMMIGEPTAEQIKKTIGERLPEFRNSEMEVRGINTAEGASSHLHRALRTKFSKRFRNPLNQIVVAVKNALERPRPNSVRTSPSTA